MNRLSGRRKSEENKRRERAKIGERVGREGGEEGRAAPSSSPVYARLASLARLFSCFFPTAEPVHRLHQRERTFSGIFPVLYF